MKILLVNGGTLDRNGVCLFMYQWAHTFSVAFPGNSMTVYFKRVIVDEALKRSFEEDGIQIIAGNHSSTGILSSESRNGIKKDLRTIFLEHYDIVHINSSVIGFTSLVLKEAKRAGVPIRISHAHGKFDESIFTKLLHNFLRLYIRKESTVYAGCSLTAGKYLFGEKGVYDDKWHMIPNAIDTDRFKFDEDTREAKRKEIGIQENELLLGAVGYLETVKNHSFLIDVMAGLKEDGINAKLIILGEDGGLKKQLLSKIQSLGLDGYVILYGKTDDVTSWLSAMDIYLMPSLSEGLPISAVEAQASGLPCILSDRISGEVDIVSSVFHLPIDKSPDAWINKIKNIDSSYRNSDVVSERLMATKEVEDAGFGVSSLKREISKLYDLDVYSKACNIQ